VRLTILVLEADGSGTRAVHTSWAAVISSLAAFVATVGSVAWLGWKLGELTARL
jgi:hypothetical protein